MLDLPVLHHGAKSDNARALGVARNKRLKSRSLQRAMRKPSETVSRADIAATVTAAWALGAQRSTLDHMEKELEIPEGVQRMIRNPGNRTPAQKALGQRRVANMRVARKARADRLAHERAQGSLRAKIVDHAQLAAAHYKANPGAYHYYAGGIANLIYLAATPRSYRSDCSQFGAAVYSDSGAPSIASVPFLYASTYTIVKSPHARVTKHPGPGDLGMYGRLAANLGDSYTHHVEIYCAEPGQEFIGHGSPPIDSLTPGRPDFYVTFDFLG